MCSCRAALPPCRIRSRTDRDARCRHHVMQRNGLEHGAQSWKPSARVPSNAEIEIHLRVRPDSDGVGRCYCAPSGPASRSSPSVMARLSAGTSTAKAAVSIGTFVSSCATDAVISTSTDAVANAAAPGRKGSLPPAYSICQPGRRPALAATVRLLLEIERRLAGEVDRHPAVVSSRPATGSPLRNQTASQNCVEDRRDSARRRSALRGSFGGSVPQHALITRRSSVPEPPRAARMNAGGGPNGATPVESKRCRTFHADDGAAAIVRPPARRIDRVRQSVSSHRGQAAVASVYAWAKFGAGVAGVGRQSKDRGAQDDSVRISSDAAQPARTSARARLRVSDFFLQHRAVDAAIAIERGVQAAIASAQRPRPRMQGRRRGPALQRCRHLRDRLGQLLLRRIEIAAPEVCPPEAIEIGGVAGIDFQRALDQLGRLVELPA